MAEKKWMKSKETRDTSLWWLHDSHNLKSYTPCYHRLWDEHRGEV